MKKLKRFFVYLQWRWEKFVDWKSFRSWYAQRENDRFFRKQLRDLEKRAREAKRLEQELCPHVAGCLGENPSYRTSIVWHTLNNGEEVGICTNCGREFRDTDSDFKTWRTKPSFNTPSSAGRPPLIQYKNFEEAPVGSDLDDRPVVTGTQDEIYEYLEKQRESNRNYAIPEEGLDALSDSQIKELLEGVRELRRKEKQSSEIQEDCDEDYDIGDD